MHIDKGANVQLCQSVRGQMSLHAIFGQGANVRGGICPTLRPDYKIILNVGLCLFLSGKTVVISVQNDE